MGIKETRRKQSVSTKEYGLGQNKEEWNRSKQGRMECDKSEIELESMTLPS